MPHRKKITLQRLASQLGLSAHTVSKALRGLPGMSEETREIVVKAASKAGYLTRDQKRGLAAEHIPRFTPSPRVFRYIWTNELRGLSLHQLILQGIQEKMEEFGHVVQTLAAPGEGDTASIQQWLDRQQMAYWDGIFIPPALPAKLERELLALELPRILINFPSAAEAVDSVIWDVGTAIRQAVRYLTEMNHTRILYIGDTTRHRGLEIRWKAFKEAMEEAGQQVRPEQHVIGRIVDKEQWADAVASQLDKLEATAILCAVEHDPAWIYYASSRAGRSIPTDCSLVSLENDRNPLVPELTRPILLVREAGARAAERMLWRMANPSKPYEHTLLQGGLYEGNTVLRK